MVSVFTKSLHIVRTTEALITGRARNGVPAVLDEALHVTWGAFSYTMLGVEAKLKPFAMWVFFSFSLLALAAFAMPASLDQSTRTAVFYACQLIPAALLVFAVPSSFALRGVMDSNVLKVTELVEKLAPTTEERTALGTAITMIQQRATDRSLTLKWALGLVWAGISWHASRTIFSSAYPNASKGEALGYILVLLVLLALVAVIVQGYASATRILFQTVGLGISGAQTQEPVQRGAGS